MIKKQIALMLMLMLLSVYQSCDKCEGGDGYKFEVTDMGARIQVFNEAIFDSLKHYKYDSLMLIVFVNNTNQIAQTSTQNTFFSSAVACSPLEPYTDDKIKSIHLIAANNASDSQSIQFNGGDTLNRFFVTDYIADSVINMDAVFPIAIRTAGQFQFFKWNIQPAQPINISFNAHIELANGKKWMQPNLRMRIR